MAKKITSAQKPSMTENAKTIGKAPKAKDLDKLALMKKPSLTEKKPVETSGNWSIMAGTKCPECGSKLAVNYMEKRSRCSLVTCKNHSGWHGIGIVPTMSVKLSEGAKTAQSKAKEATKESTKETKPAKEAKVKKEEKKAVNLDLTFTMEAVESFQVKVDSLTLLVLQKFYLGKVTDEITDVILERNIFEEKEWDANFAELMLNVSCKLPRKFKGVVIFSTQEKE